MPKPGSCVLQGLTPRSLADLLVWVSAGGFFRYQTFAPAALGLCAAELPATAMQGRAGSAENQAEHVARLHRSRERFKFRASFPSDCSQTGPYSAGSNDLNQGVRLRIMNPAKSSPSHPPAVASLREQVVDWLERF